jgi:hypothetical protein
MLKFAFLKLLAASVIAAAAPLSAQPVQTIDPNKSGEYEPAAQSPAEPKPAQEEYQPVDAGAQQSTASPGFEAQPAAPAAEAPAASNSAADRASAAARGSTVARKDVFSAAEGVFGRGTEGLAGLIENVLREQGEPSGYITGREAGGAFVLGVRYGSGTLHHGVEGDREVHWTGPSVGFDFGADANKVFVLVYNLHDSQKLFRRYPAAEGNAYVVGGFTASYMRRGDVVLIPIRLGVGARLGVNAGYMNFTEKNRWLPF